MNFLATDRTPYWLLDSVAGWRSAAQDGIVEFGLEGNLRLEALPGSAKLFFDGGAGAFECPVAAGKNECGELFLLDAAHNRVSRFNLETGEAKPIREFGGRGEVVRKLKVPRGFALLPGGGIAVCDTENHRVQLFSAAPYALLRLWTEGQGELEFRYPWGAAYADGWLYVADRGNGRVQRMRTDGTGWSQIGSGTLSSPTQLAVGPGGVLAVVDAGAGKLYLFAPGTWTPAILDGIEDPRAVVFDAGGNLYAGTGKGLVFKWSPDAKPAGGYRLVGEGVSGLDSAIVSLTLIGANEIMAIFDEQDVTPMQRLWTILTDGAFVTEGSFIGQALDSRIENCAWHRIQIEGPVPDGTSLQVEALTSADAGKDSDVIASGFAGGQTAMRVAYNNPDGLVQNQPGRYLRLRITMKSGGARSPEIHSIRVFFPRQSYLQFLPANFQEDAESRLFLERFLSIFQTGFQAVDQTIDEMWHLFDPLSTPEKWYGWLAAWLALPVDPTWDLRKKRRVLKEAATQYQIRGTVAGMQQSIADYAGVPATVLEHFRLRRWPMILGGNTGTQSMSHYDARLCARTPLWSKAFAARLNLGTYGELGSFQITNASQPPVDPFSWGASQFSVFFPADPYNPSDASTKVQKAVEQEKPAHTQAYYIPVYPRMRVGVQASLGVDTYVAQVSYLVLDRTGTLGYDSILGSSPARKNVAALGTAVPPRAGMDTRLL